VPSRLYLDLLRDEGKKLISYQDTKGLWTIGVGHLLGKTRRMIKITEEECQALFTVDAAEAEDIARRVLDPTNMWHLTGDVRQRALINMAFNRGEGNMRGSTTITPAIKLALVALGYDSTEKWKAVADAIKVSPWAKQIGKRADRLAYMLETGKDPQ
jgi:lysozyme